MVNSFHNVAQAQLQEYLRLAGTGKRLTFTHPDSGRSFQPARHALFTNDTAHVLIELPSPERARICYSYLVQGNACPGASAATSSSGRTACCGLLIAQDQPTENLQRVVQASFGLTTTAAQVATLIATGLTPKETALELGISVNTARDHLQAVFDKTGVNRQSDRVLIITRLSIILSATNKVPATSEPASAPNIERIPEHQFLIPADGRQLAYRACGDPEGHPVLYLHENLSSSRLPPASARYAAPDGPSARATVRNAGIHERGRSRAGARQQPR